MSTNQENYTEEQAMTMASGIHYFESREFARAMQFLNPFAKMGDPDAQYRVAIMLQNGLGVIKNQMQSYKMMRDAAEQGHAMAQHGLGFMYLEGECIDKNGYEALRWFGAAAEQGLAGAQTTVAMMYEQGTVIPRDIDKAKQWYAKAGFEDKVEELSRCS